jgi:hypothetical protein
MDERQFLFLGLRQLRVLLVYHSRQPLNFPA